MGRRSEFRANLASGGGVYSVNCQREGIQMKIGNRSGFAASPAIQELLQISKSHLDAVDRSRMHDGVVVGNDNFANLMVSTVFAAVAIETAFNEFIQIHCLFINVPYLQSFYANLTERYLWARTDDKINLVQECWPTPFPDGLIKEVRELFRIRNRVTHQTGRLKPVEDRSHGIESLTNKPLDANAMRHMLRHYEIAHDFLSHFGLPGNAELSQGGVKCE